MYAPKPSDKTLQTLNTLRTDEQFNTFMTEWKGQLVGALVAAENDALCHKLQGAIRVIDEFTELLGKAPAALKRRTQ